MQGRASNWTIPPPRERGDREIAAGPTEYRLLAFLHDAPERVFSPAGRFSTGSGGGNTYVEERPRVMCIFRRLRIKLLEPFVLRHWCNNCTGCRLSVFDPREL